MHHDSLYAGPRHTRRPEVYGSLGDGTADPLAQSRADTIAEENTAEVRNLVIETGLTTHLMVLNQGGADFLLGKK